MLMEQRAEFNSVLEQLQGYAQQIDNKLPMYYVVLKSEDAIKRLIAIVGFLSSLSHCHELKGPSNLDRNGASTKAAVGLWKSPLYSEP